MTLILSCITQDAIVQVSDRCLTNLATGEPVEQEANKAVFLSNRVALAYTGLAEIEGKPADIWLRDILVPHESVGHGIQLILDEATRAFAAMPGSSAAKRQAFVAAGIEGLIFGARLRGVSAPPGPLMSLASAKVAPLLSKSRRPFSDVPSGHPGLPVGAGLLSRLWSQIQRCFYRHDDLSVRDETLKAV
jgi:hypothetical protein